MSLYYLLWLISMLIMAIPGNGTKGYRIQLVLCFGFLFIFGAFRYDFGLDYQMYEDMFYRASSKGAFKYDPNERNEVGYMFINYLCPSFRFLLIATSLLISVTYFILFYKYIPARYKLLGIFLFYLCGNNTVFFMFSGIRNSIAICILILSLPLIRQRKILYFSAATLLASLIHTSALIVFPVAYLIGLIRSFDNKNSLILIGISVLLFILPFDTIISPAETFIVNNFDRYTSYIDDAKSIGKSASLLVSVPNIILIGLITRSLKNKFIPKDRFSVVGVGLLAFFFPLLGVLDMRMSIYFNAICIAGLIVSYKYVRSLFSKNVILGIFILYKSYAFFVVFLNNPYFTYYKINNQLVDMLLR